MQLKHWTMDYREHTGLGCTAPCSLYTVLLEHGLMDDPFYGTREYAAQELCREGCTFATEFDADDLLRDAAHCELVCHGLDTLCTLYLNGERLGHTDNMHRTWRFDVAGRLRPAGNRLEIRIESPLTYIEEKNKRRRLWAGGGTPGIAHLRKALYMFGWDWGPKLPDMGIFRPVELIAWETALPENLRVCQTHREGAVDLSVELEGRGDLAAAVSRYTLRCGNEVTAQGEFAGTQTVLTVENPRLWWPNGYGEAALYTLTVEVSRDGAPVGSVEKTLGLRTLTVSTQPDKWGEEFCFVVNGKKIFGMGANYIPMDNLLPRVSREKTEQLLRDCVNAHFNMLRVWGGGYYPEDYFYDLCDRCGLLVWQDFMFACINVHMSEAFEANVQAELEDNIRRIRHHACLGLLCGNNEMESGVKYWDIGVTELTRQDYIRLYERVIPEACDRLAPDIFYWPSSPSSGGGFDDPDNDGRGDQHYWDVWHGSKPYAEYRRHFFRFCSEFGFQSFPSMKTVRAYADETQLNPFSEVLESHQKCNCGNARMLTYAADNYLYPSDMDTLTYVTQLVQADAIRYGVEHMRRFRGRCMGAAYWQLNDCWPVASWSSVDCFGRWKALHYAAKRFYAPLLLSAHEEGFRVTLNVSNETLEDFDGRVDYAVCDKRNAVLFEGECPARAAALSALDLTTLDLEKQLAGFERERYLCFRLVGRDGAVLSASTLLFAKPKRFAFEKPSLKAKIEVRDGLAVIHVDADVYARYVEVDFGEADVVLSDNYFDITSGAGVTVSGKTDRTAEELRRQLRLRSVYDIR